MTTKILASAKAYVALVGAIASALLGVYAADTPVGKALTVVVVVASAFATWAVPNASTTPDGNYDSGETPAPGAEGTAQ